MDKKLTHFRIVLLFWILFCNLILQLMDISCGWVIFISNIMLFTMSGDIRKNFVSVELGGLTGLVFAYISISFITVISPVLGQIAGVMVPLSLVLFIIIILGPVKPELLNNTSFAYFTCALIQPASFGYILTIYLLGSVLVNGVCIILFKRIVE